MAKILTSPSKNLLTFLAAEISPYCFPCHAKVVKYTAEWICVVRFDYSTKWANSSTLWRYFDTILKTIQIDRITNKGIRMFGTALAILFRLLPKAKPLERTTWRNQSGVTRGTGTNFDELVPSFFRSRRCFEHACVLILSFHYSN